MRVVGVETIRLGEFPNLLFVEIATDEGIVGLGETFFGARAVEAYIHESAAPQLLGQDPLAIEAHSAALGGYVGYGSTGAEQRGASAVDIALWDILGQAAGQPLYQLLGGATRDRVPIYNTCAGYRYVRERPTQTVDNCGVAAPVGRGGGGAVRGSRRLPAPRGRARAEPALGGHPRHEDLAVRPVRGGDLGHPDLPGGPGARARAAAEDPVRGR